MDTVFIRGLEVTALIGVCAWERQVRQTLYMDVDMAADTETPGRSDDVADAIDYGAVSQRIRELTAGTDFELIEALGEAITRDLMERFALPWVRLRITKTGVVPGTAGVGICIERGERGA